MVPRPRRPGLRLGFRGWTALRPEKSGTPTEPRLDGGSGCWVDDGIPFRGLRTALPGVHSPGWVPPFQTMHHPPLLTFFRDLHGHRAMSAFYAQMDAFRQHDSNVVAGLVAHWPAHPADFSALDLLGLSTASAFAHLHGPNQSVGCGTMWALEVRPVATRPAFAGDWRRDHHDLRRVYRDGVGSSRRHSRSTSLPLRVSRLLLRRAVASDSALRAVRSAWSATTASPLRGCPVVPDFLSWGCQRYST